MRKNSRPLNNKNSNEDNYSEGQADETVTRPCWLLDLKSLVKVLISFLDMLRCILYIVIDAVENCALLNHKNAEVFKEDSELVDRIGELADLLSAILRFRLF